MNDSQTKPRTERARTRPTKPKHHQVVRTTVSLNPIVWDKAQEIVKNSGFDGLSDYLAACVREHSGMNTFIKGVVPAQ